MNIKVFGDRIIFRHIEEDTTEEKTASGLIIPQTVLEQQKQQRRNFKGEILEAGDDCKYLEKGMIIAYDQFGVAPFYDNGTEYLLAREKDIIGFYSE